MTRLKNTLVLTAALGVGLYGGAQLNERGMLPFEISAEQDAAFPEQLPQSDPSEQPAEVASPEPGVIAETPAPSPTSIPADQIIKGSSDTHYKGMSAEQVDAIENCGNTSDKVLLTFDDYGSEQHVRKIQDYLAEQKIAAIFFPNNNRFSDDRTQQLRDNGFWVGNHSYSHPDMHKMTAEPEKIKEEIKNGVQADLFRPPYGATYMDEDRITHNNKIGEISASLGKRTCMWTVDSRDWEGGSAETIATKVLNEVQPGGVVLMHMSDDVASLGALPLIKKGLADKGLELCTKPEAPTTPQIPAVLPC